VFNVSRLRALENLIDTPSALAVLRLMANSNVVGASVGESGGWCCGKFYRRKLRVPETRGSNWAHKPSGRRIGHLKMAADFFSVGRVWPNYTLNARRERSEKQ
jgi:hypothetical protein